MLTITIHDTNTERYTYTASASVLGRRYDNIAEYVSVIKPESETGRDCIMIVTYGDTVVDHIPVGDTPIAITSNLSQYASVKIGFAFLGADGYIKNSEVKQFNFLPAQKPDGFVPLPPVQKTTVEYLLSHGFTGAKLENNILSFTNAAGDTAASIELPTGGGGGINKTIIDENQIFSEFYNKIKSLQETNDIINIITGSLVRVQFNLNGIDYSLACANINFSEKDGLLTIDGFCHPELGGKYQYCNLQTNGELAVVLFNDTSDWQLVNARNVFVNDTPVIIYYI